MTHFTSPAPSVVKLRDTVLAPRVASGRQVTLGAALKRCEETGRLEAFKLNWKPGMPNEPHVFWDSDVVKVLEGMARYIALAPDPELETELDRLVALVVSAQQPDGYLNTHFTVVEPGKRWTDLGRCHELYCAGHLFEAAVADYRATGKRVFLDAACRYADLLVSTFGKGPGKRRGIPGHEEVELALCELASATGRRDYLELARYFIDERGTSPNFFTEVERTVQYDWAFQAHRPVREQTEAVGHAVRAVYLYRGMADVAAATGDRELFHAAEVLFDSIVNDKMYITGGIGAVSREEVFGPAGLLPNTTAYAESCAAIGLVFFCRSMLHYTGDGRYADVMERAIYNGVLSGISLKGDEFFYSNPLDSDASSPYATTRQPWYQCSCCPTNFCRFLPQLGTLCWEKGENRIRLVIPAACDYDDGEISLRVRGGYPYDGKITVTAGKAGHFTLELRVPGWTPKAQFKLNGRKLKLEAVHGFAAVERDWKRGDRLEFDLAMPVEVLRADSRVSDDAGRVAVCRGPVVYAFEARDNAAAPQRLILDTDAGFTVGRAPGLPSGTVAVKGLGWCEVKPAGALYSTAKPRFAKVKVTAIPYALRDNRGESAMAVWLREKTVL